MSNLEPGNLLHDRYRINRTLGKGGMGMVYLADDLTLGKPAAIKENFGIGEDSSGQFMQEAHLLAALHHSNLPRVTDYFTIESYQYLVMDYLPGDDLQTILEREGRQPWQKVIAWADQLANALTYMHSRTPPVIHRDIKPANIKLKADGSAMLVDFGIAKAAETAQKTAAGAQGFTPGFAPPEQAGGSRTGPFSDQYALAATLYNLLTGTRPVDSIKRVLEGESIPFASALNPEVPSNISATLHKAMQLRPEDRFTTIKEFISALQDSGYRLTEPEILTSSPGKRPTWFIPAMILIGLLVTAIIGLTILVFTGLPVSRPTTTPVSEAGVIPTGINLVKTDLPVKNIPSQAAGGAVAETIKPAPTQTLLAAGKWLVYSSNRADGKIQQLWKMQVILNNEGRPAAETSQQITTGTGDKTQAAWSPDGKFLLYTAPSAGGTEGNGLDIWRISADGGEPVDLTNREGDESSASWSPDGKTICFTRTGKDGGIRELYLMNSAGEDVRRISTGYEESQGIWAKNMQALFYVITASNTEYFAQRMLKDDYKIPTPFDTNQTFGRLGKVTDPAFSPDGTKLAYTRTKGRDRWIGIVDYQSRGGNFSLITKAGRDYDPAWSADGKWIAFTSERDGQPQIYIMTSAGLVQTGAGSLTARESYPAWQP
jgi:eukaryotic-like serine/threonine-protein kinase